ncbi:MAG: 4-(cytidine 5'-diphospho)-2-C-methyl-D-erythritol kinase [Gammaproteobacteria bacterium]|nr:4-(cytidine 5'-diphospho)-2-C-methyl-D-erythritol kinase [Gammaproteobacteria bacterium]MCF6230185.1 4-(cytidine 5'-diphospho)-2-C-methyl-D-erythritol kinase [Gammaproteobacteria bacterium]
MNTESWPAPAKLNLFLHITGRRADGYHELQTLFQFLDYGDELCFELRDDGEIHRATELDGIAEADDLVVKAATLLQQHTRCGVGVDIRIDKKLPMGGGLGGGSSDAATTLVALNHLWGLGLSADELAKLGMQLGADVPVFVHGWAAWAEGVGEKLTPVQPEEPWYLVLIPACHVSTAEIFNDFELTRECASIKMRDFLGGNSSNVCEPVVSKRYPEVRKSIEWLSKYAPTKMTGTGACVFASFAQEVDAQSVLKKLPENWQGFVARGMNSSPLWFKMQRIRSVAGH